MFIKFEGTYLDVTKKASNIVTITLKLGENLNIIGPSGSGKTTYINALVGLPNILNGKIFIDGRLLSEIDQKNWTMIRKQKFATVFQNLDIFDELTVEENINIVTALYENTDKKKKDFIIDSMDLTLHKKNKAKILSLGEKQRLAICRALVRPFSLLILDEPFSHLDKNNIEKCTQLIYQMSNDNQAGIILTSYSADHTFNFDKNIFL